MACACVCAGVAGCAGGVVVCVCVGFACVCFGAIPWASVACLWIGFAGWLFGGLTLLGPPAISFNEALCVPLIDMIVNSKFHVIRCPSQVVVITDNAFRVDNHAGGQ